MTLRLAVVLGVAFGMVTAVEVGTLGCNRDSDSCGEEWLPAETSYRLEPLDGDDLPAGFENCTVEVEWLEGSVLIYIRSAEGDEVAVYSVR
jgi:hypothetical protein